MYAPTLNLPKNTLGMISDHYQSSLVHITRVVLGIHKITKKWTSLKEEVTSELQDLRIGVNSCERSVYNDLKEIKGMFQEVNVQNEGIKADIDALMTPRPSQMFHTEVINEESIGDPREMEILQKQKSTPSSETSGSADNTDDTKSSSESLVHEGNFKFTKKFANKNTPKPWSDDDFEGIEENFREEEAEENSQLSKKSEKMKTFEKISEGQEELTTTIIEKNSCQEKKSETVLDQEEEREENIQDDTSHESWNSTSEVIHKLENINLQDDKNPQSSQTSESTSSKINELDPPKPLAQSTSIEDSLFDQNTCTFTSEKMDGKINDQMNIHDKNDSYEGNVENLNTTVHSESEKFVVGEDGRFIDGVETDELKTIKGHYYLLSLFF